MAKPTKRQERKGDPVWAKRVGDAVREARSAARFSQTALATEIGVDQGTISDIELGYSDPTISMIESIADALSISVDSLIGRRTPMPQDHDGGAELRPAEVLAKLADLEAAVAELQAAVGAARAKRRPAPETQPRAAENRRS